MLSGQKYTARRETCLFEAELHVFPRCIITCRVFVVDVSSIYYLSEIFGGPLEEIARDLSKESLGPRSFWRNLPVLTVYIFT